MSFPERIVPTETEPGVVALHLKRYEFALPWCAGKEVLDAACGVGYGTAVLAERARRAVGVDLSEEAIGYARRRYARPNAEFLVMDVERLGFPDGSFDVVCSFETIEHIRDRDAFLAEVVRVLRPGGTYLVSTPHVATTTHSPENPFHQIELSRADFERLLGCYFGDVELYGQRRRRTARYRVLRRLDVLGLRRRVSALHTATRLLGTRPTATLTTDDVLISKERLDEASELVAVCRAP